ncbi:MAG: FAD-binding oxidoreductase [Alphaproteobacteria bacterium]
MMTIINDLAILLGQDNVIAGDTADAMPYLIDSYGRKGMATAIALPRNVKALQKLVAWVYQKAQQKNSQSIPMLIPMGGHSGRSQGALIKESLPAEDTHRPIIIVCLKYFNKILSVNEKNNSLLAEAGVVLDDIYRAADNINRIFPIALGSSGSCHIGGVLSTNAGGYNVFRYGMARHWVLGLSVVLPNGDLLCDEKNLQKDNSGYDLKQLFLASEGTLGFIVSAQLALAVKPKQKLVGLCKAHHLSEIVDSYWQLQHHFGSLLVGFELIPDEGRVLLESIGKSIPPFLKNKDQQDNFYGLFEIDNFLTDHSDDFIEKLSTMNNIMVIAKNQKEQKALWAWRENIVWALKAKEPVARHDIAIPLDQWSGATDDIQAAVHRIVPDAIAFVFGHVGDGNFHYHFLRPDHLSINDWLKKIPVIQKAVYDKTMASGGSFSAEHGIGREKIDAWHIYKNPVAQMVSQKIKKLFDPYNIMNPGVIFLPTKPTPKKL